MVLKVEPRYPTEMVYARTSMDMLETRRNKQLLYFMFKIYNQITPKYITEKFTTRSPNYQLRNNRQIFSLPKPKSNYKHKSLAFRGTRLWNNLPGNIKSLARLELFKRTLNTATYIPFISS